MPRSARLLAPDADQDRITGWALQMAREGRGYDREEFARRLNSKMRTRRFTYDVIANMEAGRTKVDVATLKTSAELLDVSLEFLTEGMDHITARPSGRSSWFPQTAPDLRIRAPSPSPALQTAA